jgi:SH3-like domain-containing protein
MLSIRFKPGKEWWVSGKIFDQLFHAALDIGNIPREFEYWRHIADANGGFDLSGMEPADADRLTIGLRWTAEHELAQLGEVHPTSKAASYRSGLLAFLEISSPN